MGDIAETVALGGLEIGSEWVAGSFEKSTIGSRGFRQSMSRVAEMPKNWFIAPRDEARKFLETRKKIHGGRRAIHDKMWRSNLKTPDGRVMSSKFTKTKYPVRDILKKPFSWKTTARRAGTNLRSAGSLPNMGIRIGNFFSNMKQRRIANNIVKNSIAQHGSVEAGLKAVGIAGEGVTAKYVMGKAARFVARGFAVGFALDIGQMVAGVATGASDYLEGLGQRASGRGDPTKPAYYTSGVAATMRQSSMQAIYANRMSSRPQLGREAMAFHG